MNKTLTTILVQVGQMKLYHHAVAHGCKVSVRVACQFAAEGDLTLFQHALEHGCERSVEILRVAARHRQLHCLMYAHAQGCPWSSQVTLEAARGGHLKCLAYLHEHDCPWDARVRSAKRKKCILDYADAHLSILGRVDSRSTFVMEGNVRRGFYKQLAMDSSCGFLNCAHVLI